MRYYNHPWAAIALAAPILASNSLRSLPKGFDPLHKPCPRSCSENPSQADWTSYYSVDRLTVCGEPMLLTFATFYDLEDPETLVKIRACTAGDAETSVNALTEASITESVASSVGRVARNLDAADPDSPPPVCNEATPVNATAEWITWTSSHGRRSTNSSGSFEDIVTSLRNTQTFLKDALNCEESIVYGYSRGTVVGVYAGPKIQNRGIAIGFVEDTIDHIVNGNKGNGTPSRMVAQVCGGDRNSDNHLGIVIDPFGDLTWAQKALRSWSEAKCVAESASQGVAETANHGITVPNIVKKIESRAMLRTKPLSTRSDCHRIQAVYGDSIKSLASSCQVSVRDFSLYNNLPADWTPSPYQWVCCSSGVTRRATGPRPDGTCASYIVQNQDTCSIIANKQGIRQGDLYAYNQETYGWGGCNSLYPGMRICIGPGTPRLPAPNKDAVCGPTKPGTEDPVGDEKIEDLSPCPIKACCNIWGNCGVDVDFCVPTESETGNPGTAKPNTNGCVQNCGLELVTGPPPSDFIKVGYFESWNSERPCLHMSPNDIPSSYTHVHYAFADVTTDFTVSLGKFADVFDEFKALKGRKRIVAFGGWAFSTEPATYQYFRQGTKPENREKFAAACVDFVVSEGLDGIDFDWEYPGEPDIPGIPPGDEDESENYLEFVKIIRAKMPADKTVSIAAPASYWYLKQFLIEEMSKYLDYIVYMTYDLHGQWDYSNEWSQSGCKAGNCLRSHVNMTETMSALVMVTKAGVPSDKIVVGVTSYGRSFRMTDPSCTGPLCTYTGPESGATPGRCTKTGGYISNSEINELIANGGATRKWSDETQSDYVLYGNGDWVAYMDDANKESRIAKYKSLNFRGSSDWAIDLQTDFGGGGSGDDEPGETTDGTCGSQAFDIFCGSWPSGSCCSSAGLCGSTDAFCGEGCQSGCPSKDGKCGVQNKHNTCPAGSCCSADGECGTGDDFCGSGCQSGECQDGNDNIIYIDTIIWTSPRPTLQCYPPCTFVLPPLSLPSATTISIPPVTETLDEVWPLSSQGSTTVYTTKTTIITITIPAITTSTIPFSNVEWTTNSEDDNPTIIWAWTSLSAPPVTLTNEINSQNWTWTYEYGPFPSPTATTSDPNPPITFVRSSFPVRSGKPEPTCKDSSSCGQRCEHNCGPPGIKLPCIGPGCGGGGGGGGGGGIHFCIGPWCGDGGGGGGSGGGCHGSGCPGSCVGSGCSGGGGGGGGGGEGDPEDCPTPTTVSNCLVVCTTSPTPKPCSTECFGIVGCDITATTTTTDKGSPTPPPGFEVEFDDLWETPDYASLDAAWPAVSASIRDEWNEDHDNPDGGGSSGGGGGTASPTNPPYTGTECDSYTTTSQCNGDGSHHACVTQTLCVPTAPCPPAYTADGAPSCSGDQLCLGTTIFTRCADQTGGAVAEVARRTITRPPRIEATPTLAPELETTSHDEPLPIPALAAESDLVPNSNRSSTSLDLLFARQNGCGGSANGGCDYIPFCALCVTVEKVPCVKARLSAVTGPLSGTDIDVSVTEDGKEVCLVKLHCSIWDTHCDGLEDVDCGDNYALSFKWNYVNYYSPKYEQNFPLYLEREKKNNLIFCTQKFGLIDAPSGCLEDVFSIENGPCRSKKRDTPSLEKFGDIAEGLWGDTLGEDNITTLDLSSEHNVLNARAFSDFGSGGCSSTQASKLTAWVADVVVMTQAAADAITDLESSVMPYPRQIDHIATTLNKLLGVTYSPPDHAAMRTVRGYYELVGNFSNGIFPHGEAWLFCGDSFTKRQQWTDGAKDTTDMPILDANNQPLELQQLAAYKPYQRRGWQPYRIPAIGKYVFSTPGKLDAGTAGVQAGAICSNGNKNPVGVTLHSNLGFPIITICSPMNKGGYDGFTVFPHDTITQVPLQPNVGLDRHRPGSGTLLHEFMHAVRGAGAAPDRAGNSQSCFRASRTNPTDAMNAPECATLFAVAMYFQRSTAATQTPYQFSFLHAQPV